MPTNTTDRIEKEIVFDAPRPRVWRALTDVREFSAWFGVALTTPFEKGKSTSGQITIKGYEHVLMTIWVESIDPQDHFSFRWHPGAIDPAVDYSKEPTTLVTFTLEAVDDGTKLSIVETGFDALPEARRVKAFAGNSAGWEGQMRNIREYLKTHG